MSVAEHLRIRLAGYNKRSMAGCVVVLAGLVLSGPLSAHHAARMFELATPIRVKGTVVRYFWANPHSAIIVEQKTEDGSTIRWALESSSPIRVLEMRGFNKDSFKPGDVIEACGFAPKSALRPPTENANQGNARPGPAWLEGADRVITARLVLTQDGSTVHWSNYGPLELCVNPPLALRTDTGRRPAAGA
jgi:hypothetical protein